MRALQTEWTKLRSLRSTMWALLALLVLSLLLTTLNTGGASTERCDGVHCNDTVLESLAGIYLGQMAVAALAVLAITSEYTTGLIRTTFVANPRRHVVLLARAAVVVAVVLVVGGVTAVASFTLGQALLAGNGFTTANGYPDLSLLDGPVARAVGGTAIYLAAVALLALGVGTIVRHTAGAISGVLGLMLIPVIAVNLVPENVGDWILRVTPIAGMAIQQTIEREDGLPLAPWTGLGVLVAWGVVACAIGLWLIVKRDA